MAIVDRRGGVVDAASPASSSDPNPDLGIKAPVRVATTGSAIALSGLQTIDGVALGAGDRVLVMDQADLTTNGIYVASTGAWAYAVDFASSAELVQGLLIEVAQGAFNGGAIFELMAAPPITLGTTPLIFQSAAAPVGISPIFDGGNVPLTTAYQVQHEVGSRTTLKRWTLLADRTGSIVLDIWRGSFASLPLSAANSICGGVYPTLTGAQYAQSS